MKRAQLAVLPALLVAGLTAVPASATTASPSSHSGTGTAHVVAPGQSIQAAVDAADPGDTIRLQAGTYRESVLVTEDDITVRGAGSGPHGTVLLPPAEFPDNACGNNPPAPEPPPYGAGICIFGDWSGGAGPTTHATRFVHGGRITGIRFDGFAINIATVATDGVRVDHNVSLDGGHYGITHVLSKNGLVEDNTVIDAAHAGIYIGAYNIADSGSVIRRNHVERSALAISTYDSQGVTLTRNTIVDSCVGYLAFSDDLKVPGGDKLTVTRNEVVANNEDAPTHGCEPVPFIDFPETNGSGIVLVGTTESTISRNVVTDNVGDLPLSGGLVVVTGQEFRGSPATDEGSLTISRNDLSGNGPDDIRWDGVGQDVGFTRNACGTSSPAGLCH